MPVKANENTATDDTRSGRKERQMADGRKRPAGEGKNMHRLWVRLRYGHTRLSDMPEMFARPKSERRTALNKGGMALNQTYTIRPIPGALRSKSWHIINHHGQPVYGDAPDGRDKPVVFHDEDRAREVAKTMNEMENDKLRDAGESGVEQH